MIRIKDPQKNGFTTALLTNLGVPYKVVCDALVVSRYEVDDSTEPPILVVTYAKCDTTQDYMRAGPLTQHLIQGDEFITILEDKPIRVETMEASTLRTGIPSATIYPDDLVADPSLPVWVEDQIIEKIRAYQKKLKDAQMQPPLPDVVTDPLTLK